MADAELQGPQTPNKPDTSVPGPELSVDADREFAVAGIGRQRAILEQRLRPAFIAAYADDICERLSDPEEQKAVKAMLFDTTKGLIQTNFKALGMDLTEEDVRDIEESALQLIENQFSDPTGTGLRQIAQGRAEQEFSSSQQMIDDLQKKLWEPMSAAGIEISPDAMKKVLDAFSGLVEQSKVRDQMISRLTDIAENNGVEYAVSKRTRTEVAREMFPTPDAYREMYAGLVTALQTFAERVKSALNDCGSEAGQIGDMLETCIFTVVRSTAEFRERDLALTIRDIYGSAASETH